MNEPQICALASDETWRGGHLMGALMGLPHYQMRNKAERHRHLNGVS